MCTPLVLPSTTVMVSTVYPASRIQGFVPGYLIDLNEDHTSIFMALDKEEATVTLTSGTVVSF